MSFVKVKAINTNRPFRRKISRFFRLLPNIQKSDYKILSSTNEPSLRPRSSHDAVLINLDFRVSQQRPAADQESPKRDPKQSSDCCGWILPQESRRFISERFSCGPGSLVRRGGYSGASFTVSPVSFKYINAGRRPTRFENKSVWTCSWNQTEFESFLHLHKYHLKAVSELARLLTQIWGQNIARIFVQTHKCALWNNRFSFIRTTLFVDCHLPASFSIKAK